MDEELNPEMIWEDMTSNFITYYLRYISISLWKGLQQSLHDLQGEVVAPVDSSIQNEWVLIWEWLWLCITSLVEGINEDIEDRSMLCQPEHLEIWFLPVREIFLCSVVCEESFRVRCKFGNKLLMSKSDDVALIINDHQASADVNQKTFVPQSFSDHISHLRGNG